MSSSDLLPADTKVTTAVQIGELANYHAAKQALSDYQKRLSANVKYPEI